MLYCISAQSSQVILRFFCCCSTLFALYFLSHSKISPTLICLGLVSARIGMSNPAMSTCSCCSTRFDPFLSSACCTAPNGGTQGALFSTPLESNRGVKWGASCSITPPSPLMSKVPTGTVFFSAANDLDFSIFCVEGTSFNVPFGMFAIVRTIVGCCSISSCPRQCWHSPVLNLKAMATAPFRHSRCHADDATGEPTPRSTIEVIFPLCTFQCSTMSGHWTCLVLRAWPSTSW